MITAIIPYHGIPHNLSSLLVNLQPQLHPSDDIYIIDSSPDKSGVEIARIYGTTRCYVFVEVSDREGLQAVKYGYESMRDNNQSGALVIPSNALISATFIQNLKKAITESYDVFYFKEVPIQGFVDPNFLWYTKLPVIEPCKYRDTDFFYVKRSAVLYHKDFPKASLLYATLSSELVVRL